MKTAVSLPDSLFRRAEHVALRMGIPRSQLFARALEEFIDNHQADKVTERLNLVYPEPAAEWGGMVAESSGAGLDALREATRHDGW